LRGGVKKQQREDSGFNRATSQLTTCKRVTLRMGGGCGKVTKVADGIKDKRLLKQFADYGFDGMRCDVDGNLYVTRYGKGVVAVVSPQGEVIREIDVLGKNPSNLCFGGPDGRTVYVTEVEHTRIVKFRVDRPGQAWQLRQER